MHKGFVAAAGLLCLAAVSSGEIFHPPGSPYMLYTTDSNDGYSAGRGVVFSALNDVFVTDAGWYNWMPAGSDITIELWSLVTTSGFVLDGATLLASESMETFRFGLAPHQVVFDTPVELEAGGDYLVRVLHDVPSIENRFFNFDPALFGDAPFTVGNFEVIDGTQGGDTSNFVMPRMEINNVPGPAGFAVLGLAGLLGRRRR